MIPVVFSDRWLLVVDKPAGTPSQAGRDGRPGAFEHLKAEHGEVYLHHRLDTAASGLLLFARHAQANAPLTAAFRAHAVDRTYLAVAVGEVRAGLWSWPVDGQPARTEVEVLAAGSGLRLLRLRLHTGRKHQIRKHAAMAGAPLAGDKRYGGDASHAWPRLALHATRLALRHPVTEDAMAWESPLPADLAELVGLIGPG